MIFPFKAQLKKCVFRHRHSTMMNDHVWWPMGLPIKKFKHCGFTLLELLIVLTLIGLVTALVTPRLGGSLSSVQTKSTVNKLNAMLRYARNMAVTDQKTRVVIFDRVANSIVIESIEQDKEVDKITNAEGPQKSYKPKEFQLPQGIKIEKIVDAKGEQSESSEFRIHFYSAGNSSGGEITMKGKGKSLYHIKVNFITGLVDASS